MGKLNRLSKRDATLLKRKLSTLQIYLGGIKHMNELPDTVISIDQQREYTSSSRMCHFGNSDYLFSRHKLWAIFWVLRWVDVVV